MEYDRLIEFLLESYSYEEEDYWKEFNWYRENGIGENIEKDDYINLIKNTQPVTMSVNEMKGVKNSIIGTGNIDGRTEEERLKKFKDYYKKTKREHYGSLSGKLQLGNEQYLDNLIEAVRN